MLPGMMQTGFFGSAAAGDITVTVDAIVTTAVGNGDTTYSYSLGGKTPKAALLVTNSHTTASDPNEITQAIFSVGVADASADYAVSWQSRDNDGTSENDRRAFADRSLYAYNDAGTVLIQANLSFAANDVLFDYTSTDEANYRIGMMLFTGDDLSADAGTIALGTGTSAIDVTAPGFLPDVVIFQGGNIADGTVVTAGMQCTFGFATADGTQRCVCWQEADNNAAGGIPFQHIRTDCAAGSEDTGSSGTKLTVGDFDASGFSITPSASQGGDDIHYLALASPKGVKIVDITTPTSTGSFGITGAGFEPSAAIVVLTNLEVVDTYAAATSDNQGGLSITFIGSETVSHSWRINSGSDPSDTGQQSSTSLISASATDCDAIIATLTSFDADGMTLNFSVVQGTGKKGFILFFE